MNDDPLFRSEMRDSGRAGGPAALPAERTTNEAAERLREWFHLPRYTIPDAESLLDKALTAAKAEGAREAVERIVQRLEDDYGWNPAHEVCQAVLEAAR
jgi:hypothetical protein